MKKPPAQRITLVVFAAVGSVLAIERRRHPMGVDLARRGVRVQNHVSGPYRRPVRLAVPAGHDVALKARLALIGVMMVQEERRTSEATPPGRVEAADQTKEP